MTHILDGLFFYKLKEKNQNEHSDTDDASIGNNGIYIYTLSSSRNGTTINGGTFAFIFFAQYLIEKAGIVHFTETGGY